MRLPISLFTALSAAALVAAPGHAQEVVSLWQRIR